MSRKPSPVTTNTAVSAPPDSIAHGSVRPPTENPALPRYPVVSVVIRRGDRLLLGKRSLTESSASGYWCAISGGIEPGETEEQTVIREADEEIGVIVRPVRKLGELDTRDGRIRLHWWLVEIERGEPYLKNDEHSELRWVSLDELQRLQPIFVENLPLFELALKS
jgi:mutator protein MutT